MGPNRCLFVFSSRTPTPECHSVLCGDLNQCTEAIAPPEWSLVSIRKQVKCNLGSTRSEGQHGRGQIDHNVLQVVLLQLNGFRASWFGGNQWMWMLVWHSEAGLYLV